MNKKNIVLGVTGGIAAYKACDLICGLRANGHDVRVIMTENAKQFITPLSLATLSGHPVMDNMWAERDGKVEHIEVAKWCKTLVVYPATANIIGKFANGIADDLLSTVFLSLPLTTNRIVFPAMNTNMLKNLVVKDNIEKLCRIYSYYDFRITDTKSGALACGDEGEGCLISPRDAIKIILEDKKCPT